MRLLRHVRLSRGQATPAAVTRAARTSDRQYVAHKQEGQRFRMGGDEPRDDEARRPDEHEEGRGKAGEQVRGHGC